MGEDPGGHVVEEQDLADERILRRGEQLGVHSPVEGRVVIESLGQRPALLSIGPDRLIGVADANEETGVRQQLEVAPERGPLHAEQPARLNLDGVGGVLLAHPTHGTLVPEGVDVEAPARQTGGRVDLAA